MVRDMAWHVTVLWGWVKVRLFLFIMTSVLLRLHWLALQRSLRIDSVVFDKASVFTFQKTWNFPLIVFPSFSHTPSVSSYFTTTLLTDVILISHTFLNLSDIDGGGGGLWWRSRMDVNSLTWISCQENGTSSSLAQNQVKHSSTLSFHYWHTIKHSSRNFIKLNYTLLTWSPIDTFIV